MEECLEVIMQAGYAHAITVTYSGWQHLLIYNQTVALAALKAECGTHWHCIAVSLESLG